MEEKKTELKGQASGQGMPWWRKWWIIMLAVLVGMLILLLCLRLAGCCERSKVPAAPSGAVMPVEVVAPAAEGAPAVAPEPDTAAQSVASFDLSKVKPVAWPLGEKGYVETAAAFNESFERAVTAAQEANATEVEFPVSAVRYDIRDYDVSKVEAELVGAVGKAFQRTNQSAKLLVEGYTCNVGSEAFNENLSRQRAERVAKQLKNAGVSADRVEVKWYGESKYGQLPGVTEQTAHRRVTITVRDL